jgi:hypothetical protein
MKARTIIPVFCRDLVFGYPIIGMANQCSLFATEVWKERDETMPLTTTIDQGEWRNEVNTEVFGGGAACILKKGLHKMSPPFVIARNSSLGLI